MAYTISVLAGSTRGHVDAIGDAAKVNKPSKMCVDVDGNIYVADNYAVRKITKSGTVSTIAGADTLGYLDATGAAARFGIISGITYSYSRSALFVSDYDNHAIRRIDLSAEKFGEVKTIAGAYPTAASGNAIGTGPNARFNHPTCVVMHAIDDTPSTNIYQTFLYVVDSGNNCIKACTPSATSSQTNVSRVAGSVNGLPGTNTDAIVTGSGDVRFNNPLYCALDPNKADKLYVWDSGNSLIRLIKYNVYDSQPVGFVSAINIAGGSGSSDIDGDGNTARFAPLVDMVGTPEGHVLALGGSLSRSVRKIYPAENRNSTSVKTLYTVSLKPLGGDLYASLTGMTLDEGNIFVSHATQNTPSITDPLTQTKDEILKIEYIPVDTLRDRTIERFAGYTTGFSDGSGTTVKFNQIDGMVADQYGNLYSVELSGRVRKILPSGTVNIIAGSTSPVGEYSQSDGTGTGAKFYWPSDIAYDSGNNCLYITQNLYHNIRKVELSTGVVTTIAGSSSSIISGNTDGNGNAATFRGPSALAVASNSDVYVCDTDNNKIRKITKISDTYSVSSLTGTASTQGIASYTDGTLVNATFDHPSAICVDSSNIIYVWDAGNYKIRKIDIANNAVTTLAGTNAGYHDGEGLSQAQFQSVRSMKTDVNDNLFVIDGAYVRKITQDGYVTTVLDFTNQSFLGYTLSLGAMAFVDNDLFISHSTGDFSNENYYENTRSEIYHVLLSEEIVVSHGVYVGGQNNAGNVINTVDDYDVVTDVWVAKNSLPINLYQMASFSIHNGKGYVVGGMLESVSTPRSDDQTNAVYSFDNSINAWTTVSSLLPYTVRNAAGYSIGNYGYVVGGRKSPAGRPDDEANTTIYANNYRFDPELLAWSAMSSLPVSSYASTAFTILGKAYIVNQNSAYAYDPTQNAYTVISVPMTRIDAASFAIRGVGYVAGGNSNNMAESGKALRAYYVDTNSWSAKADLPVNEYRGNIGQAGMSSSTNKGFVFNGYYTNQYKPNVVVYDPLLDGGVDPEIGSAWVVKTAPTSIRTSGAVMRQDLEPTPNGTFIITRRTDAESLNNSDINTASVNLHISSVYATSLKVSNYPPDELGNLISYVEISLDYAQLIYPWTLTPGDGQKTIYMKFKNDQTDQESDPAIFARIYLETTPPEVIIDPITGNYPVSAPKVVTSTNFSVTITATDTHSDKLYYKMSNNSLFEDNRPDGNPLKITEPTGSTLDDWTELPANGVITAEVLSVITSTWQLNSYNNIYFKVRNVAGVSTQVISTEHLNSDVGKSGIAYGDQSAPPTVTGVQWTVTGNSVHLTWLPL